MTRSLTQVKQATSVWELGGLTWAQLAKRVWLRTEQDDLVNRAYELAYNFLLAVFPMLLFLIALFGIFALASIRLRSSLFLYLEELLPPAAYKLVSTTVSEVILRSGAGKITLGLLLALFSGSSGTTQLISNLNNAYGVRERRSWVKVHMLSLVLTLVISALVITALLLVLAGGYASQLIGATMGISSLFVWVWKAGQWVLAIGFVVLAFALIYYFGPDVDERHWYWITPGSVIGVALWLAASGVLRIYLHFFDSYTKTYGSLGAVIILLLWFYVTGIAFLVGGAANAVIEQAAAERGHPEAKARGQKAA